MSEIFRLMYCSVATHPAGDPSDQEILSEAVARNSKLGVTGVLLRTETGFTQVLEGDRRAVKSVYKLIKQDKRHRKVTLLGEWSDRKRMFADWAMELRNLDPNTAQKLLGDDPAQLAAEPMLQAIHKLAHLNIGMSELRQ